MADPSARTANIGGWSDVEVEKVDVVMSVEVLGVGSGSRKEVEVSGSDEDPAAADDGAAGRLVVVELSHWEIPGA